MFASTFLYVALAKAQTLPASLVMPKDSSIGDASGASFKVTPASGGSLSKAHIATSGENGVVYSIWIYEKESAQALKDEFAKTTAQSMRTGTFTGRSLGDASYVATRNGKDLPDTLDALRGKFLIEGHLLRRRGAVNLAFERANSLYLEKLMRATVGALDRAVGKQAGK